MKLTLLARKHYQELNYNTQKLRKTCVLSDTLISMVSYENIICIINR